MPKFRSLGDGYAEPRTIDPDGVLLQPAVSAVRSSAYLRSRGHSFYINIYELMVLEVGNHCSPAIRLTVVFNDLQSFVSDSS
jgi:hypothetical protein